MKLFFDKYLLNEEWCPLVFLERDLVNVRVWCIMKARMEQTDSVQLSCVWLFVTLWIAPRQASLSITNSRSSLRPTSIEPVMPSSHLILCCPFSSCPQSLLASESFPVSQLFAWGGQSIGVSASASVLPIDFLEDGLVGTPCCPRDSQESSPTPRFKSINTLVLSFLHSPTLTSIHDHWKNHNLD